MMVNHRDILANIKNFDQLIVYLRDEMGWPIESYDLEDMYFDYKPEELGIDEKNAAIIESIQRLRPLSTRQPWGIFFIKFEPKKLPVVALRRILSRVTLKKRASANSAERTAWAANDLLFISNYGEGNSRTITFAHFSQDDAKRDLPILKVLGWNDEDTALHLDGVATELTSKLAWPANEKDVQTWRNQWRSAFTIRHGEVIATSKVLSIHLAKLAQTIRNRINKALKIETEHGPLKILMKAFQNALIHDLDADGFADMYAQTIAYGLLSARITNPRGITADDLHMQIPVANPFLKELMEMFLQINGRRGKAGGPGMDFDELGISEVVELLVEAKMEAIILDFGDRNPLEDPVIHFYELFLKEYDAKKRLQRGVFYTPRPVVSYIVHSVDELLRNEFGLQDGLADTTTWGEMVNRNKNLRIPNGISPDQVFVQILDPATGTGTFLVETIDLIHRTMQAKWKAQGHSDEKIKVLWNEYVPKHLLPRLHGYELMMAPYTIAHLKIGLKLYETGYHFQEPVRVRVYLTNSLEQASDAIELELTDIFKAIAHEAHAVNEIKRNQRFTVVIGNPPYAGHSSNTGKWITQLVDDYYIVDGKPLDEKNPKWLRDDYVKFIRLGEHIIMQSGCGVHSYITNHGYIDNPTFRGFRQHLMRSFTAIDILDLHGNSTKKERCPDGSADENVFDIKQGVAIFLARRVSTALESKGSIQHAHLYGLRGKKYLELLRATFSSKKLVAAHPVSPFYLFVPQDLDLLQEYGGYMQITQVMPVHVLGFQTHRDHFVIDFEKEKLSQRIADFRDYRISNADVKEKFSLSDTNDWSVSDARKKLRNERDWKTALIHCAYRPFDVRYCYFSATVMDRPRRKLLDYVAGGENLCLGLGRQGIAVQDPIWSLVTISKYPIDANIFRRGGIQVFPLWLYSKEKHLTPEKYRRSNFSSEFIKKLSDILSLKQKTKASLPVDLVPEQLVYYIYAIFHSLTYRTRYAEFLKIDFPHLPLPGSLELFQALTHLGSELVALHLMESHKLDKHITKFTGGKNPEVEKITYSDETIWIDKAQTIGFKGVPEAVWNFHIGGYQVCEKWLKDRKGRTLSKENFTHYQKIIVAFVETIHLMQEIDDVIERHGGWPGAFKISQEKKTVPQRKMLDF